MKFISFQYIKGPNFRGKFFFFFYFGTKPVVWAICQKKQGTETLLHDVLCCCVFTLSLLIISPHTIVLSLPVSLSSNFLFHKQQQKTLLLQRDCCTVFLLSGSHLLCSFFLIHLIEIEIRDLICSDHWVQLYPIIQCWRILWREEAGEEPFSSNCNFQFSLFFQF